MDAETRTRTAFPWFPVLKWRTRDRPTKLWYVTVRHPNPGPVSVRAVTGTGPKPMDALNNMRQVLEWFIEAEDKS